MADHRSRRQKVEDMLKGATTEGERAAAQAALDRMKPAPHRAAPRPNWESTHRRCPHGVIEDGNLMCGICHPRPAYRAPTGPEAQPAGSQTRDWSAWFMGGWEEYRSFNDELLREQLRQAQARETLRRSGFKMPGDPDFDTEFTARAADANETFTYASNRVGKQAEYERIRDMLSKMSTDELQKFAKRNFIKEE